MDSRAGNRGIFVFLPATWKTCAGNGSEFMASRDYFEMASGVPKSSR